MNKRWSEWNRQMQDELKKDETFRNGISTLLVLRGEMMEKIDEFRLQLDRVGFDAMPFINHQGYENKTVAYSLYHMFRIEDIVANTLILKREEVFFTGDYQRRMNSPLITTGNELQGKEIGVFSAQLDLETLYDYAAQVYETTNELLKALRFEDLNRKMTSEDRRRLEAKGVVSSDQRAVWLIDYWCGKTVKGLIQMPFSRHWIMHVEAAGRIAAGIK